MAAGATRRASMPGQRSRCTERVGGDHQMRGLRCVGWTTPRLPSAEIRSHTGHAAGPEEPAAAVKRPGIGRDCLGGGSSEKVGISCREMKARREWEDVLRV